MHIGNCYRTLTANCFAHVNAIMLTVKKHLRLQSSVIRDSPKGLKNRNRVHFF